MVGEVGTCIKAKNTKAFVREGFMYRPGGVGLLIKKSC